MPDTPSSGAGVPSAFFRRSPFDYDEAAFGESQHTQMRRAQRELDIFDELTCGEMDASRLIFHSPLDSPPVAAAAHSPSPSSLCAVASGSAAAQHCFRDGLHCIFAFLTLEETALAGSTCISWHAAAACEPSKQCTRAANPEWLVQIARSTLRKHITRIKQDVRMSMHWHQHLSLLSTFPALTSLQIRCENDLLDRISGSDGASDLTLPPTLTHLCVRSSPLNFEAFRIAPLVRTGRALRHLELDIPSLPIDLATFFDSSLRSLEILECSFKIDFEQIAGLKLLHSLRHLAVNRGNWHPAHLEELCRDGRFTQLETIDIARTDFTMRHLTALQSLPSLTELTPGTIIEDGVGILASLHLLPNLRHCVLTDFNPASIEHARIKADTLPRHPSLTDLTLRGFQLHVDDAERIFAAMACMTRLHVDHLSIASLDPLRRLVHLSRLILNESSDADRPARDDLDDKLAVFASMPSLRALTLESLGSTRIREWELEQLKPPSTRMPQLQEFNNRIHWHAIDDDRSE